MLNATHKRSKRTLPLSLSYIHYNHHSHTIAQLIVTCTQVSSTAPALFNHLTTNDTPLSQTAATVSFLALRAAKWAFIRSK